MNSNFYKDLKSITDFSKIMQDLNYTKIPTDWFVLTSDIKDSTNAIEKGRYKDVNFISALCIIGILNIDRQMDFPYIFGGDGASLVIPNILLRKSKKVLIEAKKIAKESFGLDLRIGFISVNEIEKRGSFLEVCKFKNSNNHTQAIIRGNGLELAENILKQEYENFKIDENNTFEYQANFEGLECRWEDIKSLKDETISILIKSINENNSNKIYENCLNEIEKIAGSYETRNPIKENDQLQLSFNPKTLDNEALVFSRNPIGRVLKIFKLFVENLIGFLLIKFSIKQWKNYKNRVIKTTDTEKFDDMLRMVISLNKNESLKLEEFLEKEFKKKNLVYGIHKSDSALMTCLIFERHGKHIHFVDSSNGGYALASKGLKKRLRELGS
jgi:hypothetical protein